MTSCSVLPQMCWWQRCVRSLGHCDTSIKPLRDAAVLYALPSIAVLLSFLRPITVFDLLHVVPCLDNCPNL